MNFRIFDMKPFMKLFTFILSLLVFAGVFAQKNAKDVVGYFQSQDKTSIFKFYKSGEKYVGKLVWMKRPERFDTLNPDVSKRNKKLLGSILVWAFVKDGEKSWKDGYIYDANKGKTYKALFVQDEKGDLIMRGYIGVPVIGKTEKFIKVDFKEPH